MAIFGKKKECDICGRKIGFFGCVALADGNICEDCYIKAEIARGDFTPKRETAAGVQWYIKGFENEKRGLAEKYGESRAVFKTVASGRVQLEEILVGLPKAKAMNGLIYVYGYVITGTFRDRREAVIIHGDLKIPVNVLAVYEANEKDDINLLMAGESRPAEGPARVKMILDVHNDGMISKDDYILLKR